MFKIKNIIILVLLNCLWLLNFIPVVGGIIGMIALILYFPSLISIFCIMLVLYVKNKKNALLFLVIAFLLHLLTFIPTVVHYESLYFNIDMADKGIDLTVKEQIISSFIMYYKVLVPINSLIICNLFLGYRVKNSDIK